MLMIVHKNIGFLGLNQHGNFTFDELTIHSFVELFAVGSFANTMRTDS
jgi:hypothetical protein